MSGHLVHEMLGSDMTVCGYDSHRAASCAGSIGVVAAGRRAAPRFVHG